VERDGFRIARIARVLRRGGVAAVVVPAAFFAIALAVALSWNARLEGVRLSTLDPCCGVPELNTESPWARWAIAVNPGAGGSTRDGYRLSTLVHVPAVSLVLALLLAGPLAALGLGARRRSPSSEAALGVGLVCLPGLAALAVPTVLSVLALADPEGLPIEETSVLRAVAVLWLVVACHLRVASVLVVARRRRPLAALEGSLRILRDRPLWLTASLLLPAGIVGVGLLARGLALENPIREALIPGSGRVVGGLLVFASCGVAWLASEAILVAMAGLPRRARGFPKRRWWPAHLRRLRLHVIRELSTPSRGSRVRVRRRYLGCAE
jgi:hypothetical protein